MYVCMYVIMYVCVYNLHERQKTKNYLVSQDRWLDCARFENDNKETRIWNVPCHINKI